MSVINTGANNLHAGLKSNFGSITIDSSKRASGIGTTYTRNRPPTCLRFDRQRLRYVAGPSSTSASGARDQALNHLITRPIRGVSCWNWVNELGRRCCLIRWKIENMGLRATCQTLWGAL